MDIILWLGLGLLSGGMVSLLYDDSLAATGRNILFGVVGSIIGGGIITSWDHGRLPTLNFYFYSIIFTLMVSVIMIIAFRIRFTIGNRNYTPIKLTEKEEEQEKNALVT